MRLANSVRDYFYPSGLSSSVSQSTRTTKPVAIYRRLSREEGASSPTNATKQLRQRAATKQSDAYAGEVEVLGDQAPGSPKIS